METKFRLKIVNLCKNIEHGDITKIALSAGVSTTTVQKMLKAQDFDDLKPAMKLALTAAIEFVELKKSINNKEKERILCHE